MKIKILNKFTKLIPIFLVFIFTVGLGFMGWVNIAEAADRYWVGGTGEWIDATNHWASETGGEPAAENFPTEADNVFIDENSGLADGTLTLESDEDGLFPPVCNNFVSETGFNYTIAGGINDYTLSIYGSSTLESGVVFDSVTDAEIDLYGEESHTFTAGGATINIIMTLGSGTYTLQDNLTTEGGLTFLNGTFDANDKNITADSFDFVAYPGYVPTIIMSSGTWEATGDGNVWIVDEADEVVTLTQETSTIKLSNTAGGQFYGGGKTYNNVWLSGAANGFVDFYDSNTFNDLKIDAGRSVQFINGSTQTVSTFTATGTSGSLIPLRGISDENWTERRPSGEDADKYWDAVSSDSDGSNLIATASGGRLYTSANSGVDWTERKPLGVDANKSWRAVSSDSDGSNLIAAVLGGRLYTSANSGVDWTERKPLEVDANKNWIAVSSDSDGSHLIAAATSGRLYTSANGGVDWTERQPAGVADKDWRAVSSDSDGSHLIVAANSGRLYTSANGGVDWTERRPSGEDADKYWRAVSSDSDGSHLIAAVYGGRLYTSANSGVDWTEVKPIGAVDKNWTAVSSDSDGSNLIATIYIGQIYTSANSGEDWTERYPTGKQDRDWSAVSSDSDGSHLIVANNGGRLYTSVVGDEAGWTLSATTGTISSDYLDLSYSNATGGATFYAGADSTDGGHNTGWIFTAPPADTDITPPTPNPPTLTASGISQTSITWTLSTASDAGDGLHATPYGFSTTSGGSYTFQNTTAWTETGLNCGTSYTRYGVLKDILNNQTSEGSATASTSACAGNSSGSSRRPVVNIPTVIPGCESRTTGFSTDTGQACIHNLVNTISGCVTGNLFNTNTGQACLNNPHYDFGTTLLKNGSRGEAVKELQRFLNIQLNLNLVIDGILGPRTVIAIKQWQQAHGLVADGIVGPLTREKMYALMQ